MPRREIIGIGIVLVGITTHFWNARRDAHPTSYAEAIVAAPDRVRPELNGKVISVTGPLETEATLGDPRFLHPGRWIRLTRIVEMYGWIESFENGQPRYALGWTESPQSSRLYRRRLNHQNPPMSFWSDDWRQAASHIGAYAVNPDSASLPEGTLLPLAGRLLREPAPPPAPQLAEGMVVPPAVVEERLEGDTVYTGKGTPAAPLLGDVRVYWRVIEPGQVFTAFGELRGDEIVPHVTDGGETLWRIAPGGRDLVAPRPGIERWGSAVGATVLVLLGLLLVLGATPVPLMGGMLGQTGAALAFFVWPIPGALVAALGLSAVALSRLVPR